MLPTDETTSRYLYKQVIRFGQPSSKAGRKHLALRVQKAGPLDI